MANQAQVYTQVSTQRPFFCISPFMLCFSVASQSVILLSLLPTREVEPLYGLLTPQWTKYILYILEKLCLAESEIMKGNHMRYHHDKFRFQKVPMPLEYLMLHCAWLESDSQPSYSKPQWGRWLSSPYSSALMRKEGHSSSGSILLDTMSAIRQDNSFHLSLNAFGFHAYAMASEGFIIGSRSRVST